MRLIRTRFWFVWFWLVPAWISACGDSDDRRADQCVAGEQWCTCTPNGFCNPGLTCVDGVCEPFADGGVVYQDGSGLPPWVDSAVNPPRPDAGPGPGDSAVEQDSAADAAADGAADAAAADGAADAAQLPAGGCSNTLTVFSGNTRSRVSDMVLEYALAGSPAVNHYHLAMILIDASELSIDSVDSSPLYKDFYSPEELGDVFFNDPHGVHSYLYEASFGQVSISGTLVGWIDIGPQTMDGDDFRVQRNYYAGLAEDYLDFSLYDIIYLVGITDGSGMQIGWGLQNYLYSSQGTFEVGFDFLINSEFWNEAGGLGLNSVLLPSSSWAHELLHTLGISGHSNSLDCGEQIYTTECEIKGYGGVFSIMGENAYGTHPDVKMKNRLFWLPDEQITVVNETGEYPLCPIETAGTGTKGLRIPLPDPIVHTVDGVESGAVFDTIIIEYRRPLGLDKYLGRLDRSFDPDYLDRYKPEGEVDINGIIIYLDYENQDTDSSVLLDMHPTSSYNPDRGIMQTGNTGKFADSILPLGETFEMADQGIRITPNSATSDGGMMVRVEFF